MSHIRHHRRHHTWPHCGADLCMRPPHSLESPIFKPANALGHSPLSFQATIVPLVAEEVPNNDAEMAGIMRAPRTHRIWSLPLGRGRDKNIPITAPVLEARKPVHRSGLRRPIRRPPLDKSRSLLVIPTTMTRDQAMISGRMPPRLAAQPVVVSDRVRPDLSVVGTARVVERRHRRCHSEQPRSWRRPSEGIWTLQEERE